MRYSFVIILPAFNGLALPEVAKAHDRLETNIRHDAA